MCMHMSPYTLYGQEYVLVIPGSINISTKELVARKRMELDCVCVHVVCTCA